MIRRIGQLNDDETNMMLRLKRVLHFGVALIGSFVAALASTPDQSEEDEGDLPGLFNYRTGKFDNGTDPYGWYEEDL